MGTTRSSCADLRTASHIRAVDTVYQKMLTELKAYNQTSSRSKKRDWSARPHP